MQGRLPHSREPKTEYAVSVLTLAIEEEVVLVLTLAGGTEDREAICL